jgi:hypothetical protein
MLAPLLSAAAVAFRQVDVSGRVGVQAEPTIAASPRDAKILLAASNDDEWGVATFSSADGGMTWTPSSPMPESFGADCAFSDPGVAIADDGRELVSYITIPCASASPNPPISVYVSRRAGPGANWEPVLVASASNGDNDMPALVWDNGPSSPHHGRAYLVWDRSTRRTDRLVISHSDDGGRSWSDINTIRGTTSRFGPFPIGGLEVGAGGTVYVTWEDADNVAWVDRSTDGGQSFRAPVRVAATRMAFSAACQNPAAGGSTAVPAQAWRCVDANDSLAVTRGRIVVVYTARARGNVLAVYARRFSLVLRRLSAPIRIRPSNGRVFSDQFLPVTAADPNSGVIWACWYDTSGDVTRRSVLFTCSNTRDGRHWANALPVASVRSDESRPPANDFQYGDYEGLAVGADGVAHPVWTDSRDLATFSEEIYTTALTQTLFDYWSEFGRSDPVEAGRVGG